jgi:hypothetical protein
MNVEGRTITFDEIKFGKDPFFGTIVMHITSFTTIKIVSFDPRIAQASDFMMIVIHISFHMKVVVLVDDTTRWLKLGNPMHKQCMFLLLILVALCVDLK